MYVNVIKSAFQNLLRPMQSNEPQTRNEGNQRRILPAAHTDPDTRTGVSKCALSRMLHTAF
jgi:hypothetical protein